MALSLSETASRRHNCRWSHDEKQRLFDLYEQQRLNKPQVAHALDRSESAVKARICEMKKSGEWSRLQPRRMWNDRDIATLIYTKIMRPDESTTDLLPSYRADEIERQWREIYPSVLAGIQHQKSAMGTNTSSSWAETVDDVPFPVPSIEGASSHCEGPSNLMMTRFYTARQAGQLHAPASRDYQYEDVRGLLPTGGDQQYSILAGRPH